MLFIFTHAQRDCAKLHSVSTCGRGSYITLSYLSVCLNLLTTLHGTPTAVVPAGMDLLTNAIAPITAFSPISMSWRAVIDVRIPMYAPSFITILLCSCFRP